MIGESYGTTRGGVVEVFGVAWHVPNGVMLVSVVLNFGTVEFDPGNDLPYALIHPRGNRLVSRAVEREMQRAGLRKC